MRVLIASSGFKESLGPDEVAESIARGILKAAPETIIDKAPLVDGGEGFTTALVSATRGELHDTRVTGPVGDPVDAHFGFLGGTGTRTAVLDMASAAGLRLVPRPARNPGKTTTYGVGELIRAVLDAGAERILVGLGDSGTSDGGTGAAQALGVRLTNEQGFEIPRGGLGMAQLAHIDLTHRDARLGRVPIDVVCNTHNVLCGPNGAAQMFAPQKGASPAIVQQLSAAFDNYAAVIEAELKLNVRQVPGGGASGGLGAGLLALLGGRLHSRYDVVMKYLQFDELLEQADLVITSEGSIDLQTPRGKIPAEVAARAKACGLPVIALVGSIGAGADINYQYGIDSMMTIVRGPCTLGESMDNASSLLQESSERLMRTVLVGAGIASRHWAKPGKA